MCGAVNRYLYKGTRYQCHQGSEDQQKEHNRMCYECASVIDDSRECTRHYEPPFIDYEDYPVEPTLNSDL